jgi:2-succinyl-6-hydroxy-2,4-cyclohexadiene-1-carboxylate synthase
MSGGAPRVRRTPVHGIEIEWEEHGAGERALVLVHGFTGSRRDFAPRAAALAAFGRTVLPDLRGHGGSSNTGDAASYSLDQLVEDLLAFVEVEGLAGCDLLGHSLGGMVALRAGLAAPERFGSLILMNTAARAPVLPRAMFDVARKVVEAAGLETLLELMRRRDPDETGRTGPDRRLEAEWGEAYWSEWRGPNYRAMDPVAYGALGAALFEQEPLGARLGGLRLPTLVLVGAEDDGFLAAADELAGGIPGARRVTIPEAGHQPQLETPRAWLEAIRAHLAQVRGQSAIAGS